jgi:putative transcriptional regulator
MKSVFNELMGGLDDVEQFLAGRKEGFKIHVPEEVDVKRIRTAMKMTQSRFSDTFGFSIDAVKNWETGRRTPESPARTLLTVIERNPGAVISALYRETGATVNMKKGSSSRERVKATFRKRRVAAKSQSKTA